MKIRPISLMRLKWCYKKPFYIWANKSLTVHDTFKALASTLTVVSRVGSPDTTPHTSSQIGRQITVTCNVMSGPKLHEAHLLQIICLYVFQCYCMYQWIFYTCVSKMRLIDFNTWLLSFQQLIKADVYGKWSYLEREDLQNSCKICRHCVLTVHLVKN